MKTTIVLAVLLTVVPAQQQTPSPTPQPDASQPLPKNEKQKKAKQTKADKLSIKIGQMRLQFPSLDEQHLAMIVNHQIFVGMTVDMLRASWVGPLGPVQPIRVNNTHTESGVQQQAIYETLTKRIYVYISNGVVTAYQVEDR